MNVNIEIRSNSPLVSPYHMKCGEIGIIENWPHKNHIGIVVQKYNNSLITLGKSSGEGWSSTTALSNVNTCGIRLLKVGDTITIK